MKPPMPGNQDFNNPQKKPMAEPSPLGMMAMAGFNMLPWPRKPAGGKGKSMGKSTGRSRGMRSRVGKGKAKKSMY